MRKNTNSYIKHDTYAEIHTTKGDVILVDAEDLPTLSKFSWYVTTKGYSATKVNGKLLYMHRMLMNPENLQVDHINHDKLDNRKFNLRIVTNQENQFNRPVNSNNTSGVTGVYWNKDCRKLVAQITIDGRTISGGLFQEKEEAVQMRKALEQKYFK